MTRTTDRRLGSAHVLALTAICLSVGGGGYALAGPAAPADPGPTTGYATAGNEAVTQPEGRANLVSQLVVPAGGYYAVSAKVVLRKGNGDAGFSNGPVTCRLSSVPRAKDDTSTVTLTRGTSTTLALLSMGGTGAAVGSADQAFDLSCASRSSKYVVVSSDITAIALDDVVRR